MPGVDVTMTNEDHGGTSMDQDHFSSLWDWGNLLDFTVDEEFSINLDSIDAPVVTETVTDRAETGVPDRTRKRDMRLSCSNFLAGRIPCSCPEVDEKLEEEERARLKKRVRITGVGNCSVSCQVPGCKADISELKGYHKRHRVCLCCANASAVLLEGESKRYCQQCGKFHMLLDFDEDKRSCRRKLERHNNRRRRKLAQSMGEADKESNRDLQTENASFDACFGKDSCSLIGNPVIVEDAPIESEDGQVSIVYSASDSQNHNNDGCSEDARFSLAPSCVAGKDGYSSVCPTGRICFKLYDWNPAEFPRRLRHQVF